MYTVIAHLYIQNPVLCIEFDYSSTYMDYTVVYKVEVLLSLYTSWHIFFELDNISFKDALSNLAVGCSLSFHLSQKTLWFYILMGAE